MLAQIMVAAVIYRYMDTNVDEVGPGVARSMDSFTAQQKHATL